MPDTSPDFSLEGYRALLRRALALGYQVTCFARFQEPTERPVLLLRHDIDHCMASALRLARAEAALEVPATYFVQVASPLYNVRSREVSQQLQQLRALGHELGLHYDASLYTGPRGRDSLRRDLELLAECSGGPITSASQHIPIDGQRLDLEGLILHEAYQARFTQGQMQYISDSLMRWRQATPGQLLERRASFQWLTHPLQWAHPPLESMEQALQQACRDHQRQTAAYFEALGHYYARLLRERAQRDAAFRQQRGWEVAP